MPSLLSHLTSHPTHAVKPAVIGISLAAVLATVSCAAQIPADSAVPTGSAADPTATYPTHIHGLAVEPDTQQVLIASHEGLFEVDGPNVRPTGANIDLMGFTVSADGEYLASGHPGPGVDLPNPVGLISSTDGKRWTQVALGGESDFHTLTATSRGIIGFDGTLRLSEDGTVWTKATTQISPFNLAGNPASELAVATTEEGIYRSTDAGRTWTKEPDAPVVLIAAVTAQSDIVGVLPSGDVITSADAGISFSPAGSVSGQPSAVTVAETAEGTEIWVATADGLEKSIDDGRTFTTVVDAT